MRFLPHGTECRVNYGLVGWQQGLVVAQSPPLQGPSCTCFALAQFLKQELAMWSWQSDCLAGGRPRVPSSALHPRNWASTWELEAGESEV